MSVPRRQTHCIVCQRAVVRAISFAGHRLCPECEEAIVALKVDDEVYDEVVKRLRASLGSLAEVAASYDDGRSGE